MTYKLTRNELRILINEEIRKVKGGWKVYPKKPKKGEKRRKALSKKPHKTYKSALQQLKAVEASKSMKEAYVKRHKIEQVGDGTVKRQELVKPPQRVNPKFVQQYMDQAYREREYFLANKVRDASGLDYLDKKDRKGLLAYLATLDEDILYNLQEEAFKQARNLTLSFVQDMLQSSPETASDYPGNEKLVDATNISQIFYTENDFDYIFPDPKNIPFNNLQRVARLSHDDYTGKGAGSIKFHGGEEGKVIDDYVHNLVTNTSGTDPKIGSDATTKKLNLPPKKPDNFIRDPDFETKTITSNTETLPQDMLDYLQIQDFDGEFLETDIYDKYDIEPGMGSKKATRDFMKNR